MKQYLSESYNEKARQAFPDEFKKDGQRQLYTHVVMANSYPQSLHSDEFANAQSESNRFKLITAEALLMDQLLRKHKGFKNHHDENTSYKEYAFVVPSESVEFFKEDAYEILDLVRADKRPQTDTKIDILKFTHADEKQEARVDILRALGSLFNASLKRGASRDHENRLVSRVAVDSNQKDQFMDMFKRLTDILDAKNPQPSAPANDTGPSI